MSPSALLYHNDDDLFAASKADQLLLWARARKTALESYRSSIVLRSIGELGFQLQYQDEARVGSCMESNTSEFLTVAVTEVDVEQYELIRNNQSLIPASQLTQNQCRKIATLHAIGWAPTTDIDEDQAASIVKQISSLKNLAWIKRIADGRCELVHEIVDADQ